MTMDVNGLGLGLVARTAAALALTHPPLIDKAVEHERLLKLKSGLNSVSDVARATICLDFAAALFDSSFKMELAIKIAGIRKKSYMNNKKIIGKLLNIEEDVNVDNLCVKMNCTEVRELAGNLLSNFSKGLDAIDPRFVYIAVYQACKLQKFKIPKSTFLLISNLTSKIWNELETKWKSRVNHFSTKKTPLETILNEDKTKDIYAEEDNWNKTSTQNSKIENYEIWKERILKEAFEEVSISQSTMSN